MTKKSNWKIKETLFDEKSKEKVRTCKRSLEKNINLEKDILKKEHFIGHTFVKPGSGARGSQRRGKV